jgi:hypothetical protein
MITNLWEMIAFPLRWSMEYPGYYRFVIGKDESSIVSVSHPFFTPYLDPLRPL